MEQPIDNSNYSPSQEESEVKSLYGEGVDIALPDILLPPQIEEDKTKKIFSMLVECIQEIHHGDKVYNRIDVSKKELNEFIDSFDTTQFKKVSNFFETMPRLRHIVEVTNPETKVKSEVPIEGLASFLV